MEFKEPNYHVDSDTSVDGNAPGILVRHRRNVNNDPASVNSEKLNVLSQLHEMGENSRQVSRIRVADGRFSSKALRSPVDPSVNLFPSPITSYL